MMAKQQKKKEKNGKKRRERNSKFKLQKSGCRWSLETRTHTHKCTQCNRQPEQYATPSPTMEKLLKRTSRTHTKNCHFLFLLWRTALFSSPLCQRRRSVWHFYLRRCATAMQIHANGFLKRIFVVVLRYTQATDEKSHSCSTFLLIAFEFENENKMRAEREREGGGNAPAENGVQ